jgi:hypothetical protein
MEEEAEVESERVRLSALTIILDDKACYSKLI